MPLKKEAEARRRAVIERARDDGRITAQLVAGDYGVTVAAAHRLLQRIERDGLLYHRMVAVRGKVRQSVWYPVKR